MRWWCPWVGEDLLPEWSVHPPPTSSLVWVDEVSAGFEFFCHALLGLASLRPASPPEEEVLFFCPPAVELGSLRECRFGDTALWLSLRLLPGAWYACLTTSFTSGSRASHEKWRLKRRVFVWLPSNLRITQQLSVSAA